MRVFLSFNSHDQPLAEAFRAGLNKLDSSIDLFYAPVSLTQGFWMPRLADEISGADAFVLLLGPRGVGPWQEVEYHEAFDRHVAGPNFPIVPVIAKGGTAPGLPFLRQLNLIEAAHIDDTTMLARVLVALRGGAEPMLQSRLWRLVHPYRGLEAMNEAGADYFFGRERETRQVLAALAEKPDRFPLLIGASGVGKSSVAQAGVLSALKSMRVPTPNLAGPSAAAFVWPEIFGNSRRDWVWLTLRPGDHPLQALAGAFIRLWVADATAPDRGPLARQWAEGLLAKNTLLDLIEATQDRLEAQSGVRPTRVLVYVDQGEELYTRAAREGAKEAQRFSELIAGGLADPRLMAFGSMRADYFHKLQSDRALFDKYEHIDIPPLAPAQLLEVVTKPVAALGVTFADEELPQRITNAAASAPGAMPLLSYLLTDMWSAMVAKGDGVLRMPGQAIDIGGVLAGRAEEFFAKYKAKERALERLLTLRLTLVPTEGGPVKRPARRTECDADEWAIAEQLSDHPWRLVVIGERGDGAVTAEVAHEALLTAWPRLDGWLREQRDFLIFKGEVERSERRWGAAKKGDAALLKGLDLSRATEWITSRRADLTPEACAFIDRSIVVDRSERDRRLRFQRRVSWGAGTAALLLAGLGSAAGLEWLQSELRGRMIVEREQQLRDESLRSLTAQSRFLADLAYARTRQGDTAAGMLYALEALPDIAAGETRPVVEEAVRSLLNGGQQNQEMLVLQGHAQSVQSAAFSPDGKHILTASLDHTARLWRAADGAPEAELHGHTGGIVAAHFSANGRRIVTASLDGTARVWDAATGVQVAVLKGHESTVWAAVISQDGKRVATASEDQTARIWDAETGSLLFTLDGHYDIVLDVQFSPDGTRVATASQDGTARLWDAATGQLRHLLGRPDGSYFAPGMNPPPLPPGTTPIDMEADKTASPGDRDGHVDTVYSVRFSPDGKRLLTASRDWTAILWDAETGKQLTLLEGHNREVRIAAFSPDGLRILTTSGTTSDAVDNSAAIWNLAGDRIMLKLGQTRGDDYSRDVTTATRASFGGVVWTASFSPDGTRILAACEDGTASIWDAKTGQQVAILRGHKAGLTGAAFSPDGKHIVTSSRDGTARLWSIEHDQALNTFHGHNGGVLGAQFSADGSRILSTSEDATARLWDVATGRVIKVMRQHEELVRDGRFSFDGRRMVTTAEDSTARLWDAEDGALIATLGTHYPKVEAAEPGKSRDPIDSHFGMIWRAQFSPDGRRLVTVADDNSARIWDTRTGRTIARLLGHTDAVWAVDISHDGGFIVTGSRDATARVWNAETGEQITAFEDHDRGIHSVQFSPDSTLVLSAAGRTTDAQDNTARIWVAKTGESRVVMRGHLGTVLMARFSPDGSRVVTASEDGTARLWEAATGREIGIMKGHEREVRSAYFSPDGRSILTASKDGTARLWDAATLHQTAVFAGQGEIVWDAEFSADGTQVVTAAQDASIRVWDVKSGTQVVIDGKPEHAILDVAISADGTRIVTGSADGTARVWDGVDGRQLGIIDLGNGKVTKIRLLNWKKTPIFCALSVRPDPYDGTMDETTECRDLQSIQPLDFSSETKEQIERILSAVEMTPAPVRLVTLDTDAPGTVAVKLLSGERFADGTPLTGHTQAVSAAVAAKDGRRLATASRDTNAIVWDLMTAKTVAVLQGHTREVRGIDFSPDGTLVATAAGGYSVSDKTDDTARIWRADTGEERFVLRGHDAAVETVMFSPDGTRVLTASRDGTARTWVVATGESQLILRGHADALTKARFSNDGSVIVTASKDGTARVWNATTGATLIVLSHPGAALAPLPAAPKATNEETTDISRLITRSRELVPRCLTEEERLAAFLTREPPSWCRIMKKWPYGTARSAPVPEAAATPASPPIVK